MLVASFFSVIFSFFSFTRQESVITSVPIDRVIPKVETGSLFLRYKERYKWGAGVILRRSICVQPLGDSLALFSLPLDLPPGSTIFGDSAYTNQLTPVRVKGSHLFRQITGGAGHTCAIDVSQVAYCWGSNRFGQLGDGTQLDRLTPTPVRPLAGS